MKTITAILVLTSAFGIAGPKERDWQTGTLLDPDRNHYFAASTPADSEIGGGQGFNGFTYHQNLGGVQSTVDHYVIETPDSAYLVERTRLNLAKAAALHRYQPVKFAVEKNKVWVVDQEGKEYEAKIVKRVLRQPPTETPASLASSK
jgi:hypothetical protein